MAAPTDVEHEAFVRMEEVSRRTGLHRTSIYKLVKAGTFPEPRRISERVAVWLESELVEWMRSLPVADLSASAPARRDKSRDNVRVLPGRS